MKTLIAQNGNQDVKKGFSKMETIKKTAGLIFAAVLILGFAANGNAARLKDMADIEGVRENQLVGYGLVVGLDGTGDGDDIEYTVQSMASFLKKSGINIDPNMIKFKNAASVLVTAQLPPFTKPGSKINILVSSIGDAENLQGGTLLLTPLKGPDGKVYAVAQGAISIGGFNYNAGGSSVQKNHPTVGKIVSGAIVEREVEVDLLSKSAITISLRSADFNTANQAAAKINEALGGSVASALDSASIVVSVPEARKSDIVKFISEVEAVEVKPDFKAKIVFDERTGTVIMGENVRISTVAIAHGNISIQVSQLNEVSQPNPDSKGGTTAPVTNTGITVQEEKRKIAIIDDGVTLGQIVTALNGIGVTPRDLIAILQAMQSAGALQAELVIL